MAHDIIIGQLKEAAQVLNACIHDKNCIDHIERSADMMAFSLKNGGKIMTCGNGGSHCDAMHFAEELTGKYRGERAPLPAIAISDASHITCVGNDYGFDQVFSRYVEGVGRPGDVLLAISTSGASANIINAVHAAKKKGMNVVALTGKSGGNLAEIADIEIRVSHDGYADRIQEIHIKIIHILILLIEQKIIT